MSIILKELVIPIIGYPFIALSFLGERKKARAYLEKQNVQKHIWITRQKCVSEKFCRYVFIAVVASIVLIFFDWFLIKNISKYHSNSVIKSVGVFELAITVPLLLWFWHKDEFWKDFDLY